MLRQITHGGDHRGGDLIRSVLTWQVQQHGEPGGPLDQGADRRAALFTDDQSGSPGALLRRGPLRTGLAAFTASGSSKS